VDRRAASSGASRHHAPLHKAHSAGAEHVRSGFEFHFIPDRTFAIDFGRSRSNAPPIARYVSTHARSHRQDVRRVSILVDTILVIGFSVVTTIAAMRRHARHDHACATFLV